MSVKYRILFLLDGTYVCDFPVTEGRIITHVTHSHCYVSVHNPAEYSSLEEANATLLSILDELVFAKESFGIDFNSENLYIYFEIIPYEI